jgi:hypothetical protein
MLRKIGKSLWRCGKSLGSSGNDRGGAGCFLGKVWGLAELCCASRGGVSIFEAFYGVLFVAKNDCPWRLKLEMLRRGEGENGRYVWGG